MQKLIQGRRLAAALSLLLVVMFATGVQGQSVQQAPPNTNPNVVITIPQSVDLISGQAPVFGTVNLPNLSNYFLEFRPIIPGTFQPEDPNDPWVPATLPQTGVVIDELLGTWDTSAVPDGLYQIRLTANVSRQGPTYFVVGPVRVRNEVPDQLAALVTATPVSQATSQPIVVTGPTPTLGGIVIQRPTLAASPTSISNDPIVTANVDSNVRSGDTTAYPVIGSLPSGNIARIIGISNSGSGWYYIELDNGRRGFIAPTIVQASGNLAGLQSVSPPPPPATPTPTSPPPSGDVIPNGMGVIPNEPRCAEQFEVQVNVTNAGTSTFTSGGQLTVRAVHNASGSVGSTATGSFPALTPGQNFVVVVYLTVNQFPGEDYRLVAVADSAGQIIETNENNNTFTSPTFRLRSGSC
jgi:hypothetical protein